MYDAIIILGGSFKKNGELMPWVLPRLDTAMNIETKWFIVTSRATYHKNPVLDKNLFPIDESTIMADYLMKNGVNSDKILKESWSMDTIGNAYGCLMFHCLPLNLKNLLVITSDFHMPRSRSIFEKVFSLIPDNTFHLEFIETESSLTISDKERTALITWNKNAESFHTIKDLHNFLFLQHNCYCTEKHPQEKYELKDLEMYLGTEILKDYEIKI